MVRVFAEVRRVLRPDGVCFLNLGDSYNGSGGAGGDYGKGGLKEGQPKYPGRRVSTLKPKDLCGIPWRVALALQDDGWYLRQDIIWSKPNPMPESVRDRCTKAHEYIFLLAKSARYYWDGGAIAESSTADLGHGTPDDEATRNARSVWTITTKPFKGAHFATFPQELPIRCIKAGSRGRGRRCDCENVIHTPTGTGRKPDPTLNTGRAGMNRERNTGEGTRAITRREQRSDALQMKKSSNRAEMEKICGEAFSHYIRTDNTGARPLPPETREAGSARLRRANAKQKRQTPY